MSDSGERDRQAWIGPILIGIGPERRNSDRQQPAILMA